MEMTSSLWVPRSVSPTPEQHLSAGRPSDHRRVPASMIARCGPQTRLPHARTRAELAGAARPLRHREGRRDPHAAPRGRRAAPHQLRANTDLARPARCSARSAGCCPSGSAVDSKVHVGILDGCQRVRLSGPSRAADLAEFRKTTNSLYDPLASDGGAN